MAFLLWLFLQKEEKRIERKNKGRARYIINICLFCLLMGTFWFKHPTRFELVPLCFEGKRCTIQLKMHYFSKLFLFMSTPARTGIFRLEGEGINQLSNTHYYVLNLATLITYLFYTGLLPLFTFGEQESGYKGGKYLFKIRVKRLELLHQMTLYPKYSLATNFSILAINIISTLPFPN